MAEADGGGGVGEEGLVGTCAEGGEGEWVGGGGWVGGFGGFGLASADGESSV